MSTSMITSLDKQMEELITRVNDQEELIKSYRLLTESLKNEIKELKTIKPV